MTLLSGPRHGGLDSEKSKWRSLPSFFRLSRIVERVGPDAVGVEERLARVDAVGDLRDVRAHHLLGAVAQLLHARGHGLLAVAVDQRREPLLAHRERGDLRLDVADPLLRHPDVREDDRQDVLVHHALAEELHRRQPQPLLLHLGRARREPAGHRAARVRPVAGVRQVRPQPAAVEERLHHLHVHQVRAARVRVVDDEDVAGLEAVGAALRDVLDHRARRELHDADEDRQPELALRDDLAVVLRVDAVGAVEALRDDGRERRALEGEVHLARDLLQPVLDDDQRDRIDRLHASPPHGDDEVAERVDLDAVARLDHRGRVELLHDGRPVEPDAGGQAARADRSAYRATPRRTRPAGVRGAARPAQACPRAGVRPAQPARGRPPGPAADDRRAQAHHERAHLLQLDLEALPVRALEREEQVVAVEVGRAGS